MIKDVHEEMQLYRLDLDVYVLSPGASAPVTDDERFFAASSLVGEYGRRPCVHRLSPDNECRYGVLLSIRMVDYQCTNIGPHK